MYQEVVTLPMFRFENERPDARTLTSIGRFVPFVWMCVWTMLVTGTAMMMFNPKFVFMEFPDGWSILLAFKQAVFAVMVFFSFGYARMYVRLREISADDNGSSSGQARLHYNQLQRFGRVNIALGIVGILLAAGMK
jgi:uncharacterized membrane protein